MKLKITIIFCGNKHLLEEISNDALDINFEIESIDNHCLEEDTEEEYQEIIYLDLKVGTKKEQLKNIWKFDQ